jgi:hypothetical protein
MMLSQHQILFLPSTNIIPINEDFKSLITEPVIISHIQDGKGGQPPDIRQSPNRQESEATNDLADKQSHNVTDFIQKGK